MGWSTTLVAVNSQSARTTWRARVNVQRFDLGRHGAGLVKEGEQVGLGEQLGEGPQHLLAVLRSVVDPGEWRY